MKRWASRKNLGKGFTIVELLIVIVVIGILAAITIVSYNGLSGRATDARIQNDIRQVYGLIEAHAAQNGSYPSTGNLSNVYIDSNCPFVADSTGAKAVEWVPGIGTSLPQNPGLSGRGINGVGGCYTYASDGSSYVLSAWNAKRNPDTSVMYRKTGWREVSNFSSNAYYCDHANLQTYYSYSYTISNIASCG